MWLGRMATFERLDPNPEPFGETGLEFVHGPLERQVSGPLAIIERRPTPDADDSRRDPPLNVGPHAIPDRLQCFFETFLTNPAARADEHRLHRSSATWLLPIPREILVKEDVWVWMVNARGFRAPIARGACEHLEQ
jgi:hypothetical protein